MNLVTNARDAMPNGGRLTIEVLAATQDQKLLKHTATRDILDGGNPFDEKTLFMHKPYSPNDLLTRTRELLDKK